MDKRILILAPRGRDAEVMTQLLRRDGHACCTCRDVAALVDELERSAGAAVIAEEALVGADLAPLDQWLATQAAWSDFPFILLATRRVGRRPAAAFAALERLGNLLLLERPLNAETLSRAVAAALRARARQYQAHRQIDQRLEAQERLRASQEALAQLNSTLESRIADRTRELAQANDRLMKEINEREKAQAALLQSQKMEALGQLTGGMAHDFNNLLNVIMGNADLIMRASGDPRVKQMASVVKRATERGAKLTSQLLAFSRSGNLDLKAVDVVALIAGIRDLVVLSVGSGIEIVTVPEADAAWTLADANQLELAILNLAINARDAMPEGGRLTIRAGRRQAPDEVSLAGEYAVISVTDTGVGIRPDIVAKVFDPFFTTKSVGKGTGLGLSQVYGIASQAGGTARIASEVGRGTTVEIWLPLRPDEAASADAPPVEGLPEGGHEKILVVEDDADVRAFLVECLQMLGYHVTQAMHGMAGLERIGKDDPDLLIVDFAMPGMNGAEVISQVRRDRPQLPIILATGYADVDTSEGSPRTDAVLRKPFQLNDLARTVKAVLARPAG